MKSLVVLFFGMFLWTQPAFARHADVTFFADRGERFQLVLDGRLVNRYVTDQLHLPAIPAGYHVAEIRLPGRFGALVHRTRIFVEPGFRTDYLVQVAGRRPQVVVSMVRQYPLPIVGRPVPAPYRPYPGRPGYYPNPYRDRGPRDRYERDRDYHRDRDDHDRRDHDRRDNDHRDNDRRDNDHRDNDRRDHDRFDNNRRHDDRRHDDDRNDDERDDDRETTTGGATTMTVTKTTMTVAITIIPPMAGTTGLMAGRSYPAPGTRARGRQSDIMVQQKGSLCRI